MRFSLRQTVIGGIYILGVLLIARVFLHHSVINDQTPSVRKLHTIKSRVRDINFSFGEKKREDETWNDWHKDRLKNDRLFFSAFATLHSDLSLPKYRSEKLRLILCVFSSPSNGERRQAIRKTWANPSLMPAQNTTLWFILGQSNSSKENRKVLREKEEFGDIIIGNFTDSEDNDTLKLLFSMYYVITSHPSVEEMYFGFDSTYVHIQHLYKKLMFRENSGIGQWRGYVIKRLKPVRNKTNRMYVSESLFSESVYPSFCSLDSGFTISFSLGKQILFMARNETLFVFPDVFIGMLAQKTNIEIVKDVSFGHRGHRLHSNNFLCDVRARETTYTFTGDPVDSWKTLTNLTEMRKCVKPDIDVVLPKMTDNRPYFNGVLQYLNNNERICSVPEKSHDERTFIVALISSFVGNFEQRLAIRETWGSKTWYYGRIVRHLFVLGKATKNKNETQAKVDEESRKYGDIIQGNFDESFHNLTLKVVLGLKWVKEFCPNAAYLYKGDEDMFVAWPRIVLFLLQSADSTKKLVMKHLYLGVKLDDSPRVKDPKNKYFVNKNVYYGDYYPSYCSGGSYILSTYIIPELYRWSLRTPLIPIDDVYQGFLTEQIGVYPIEHKGFKLFTNKTACILQDPHTHTLHGFNTSELLRKVWFRYIHKKNCLEDT